MTLKIKNIRLDRLQAWQTVTVLAVLVVMMGFFWHKHTKSNSKAISPATSSNNLPASPITPNKLSINNSTSQKNPEANGSSTSSSLINPYGTYASDHSPTSIYQAEESSCITTPGATCKIQFTLNAAVKSLQASATDSNGVAGWSWTPRQVGLSVGSWKITMIATSGNQTKTSSDLIVLQIP